MNWFVYIVKCRDHTLYTGVTNNLDRRMKQHNDSKSRTKYTMNRRPVTLVYVESGLTHSKALRREIEIKRLRRWQKDQLVEEYSAKEWL